MGAVLAQTGRTTAGRGIAGRRWETSDLSDALGELRRAALRDDPSGVCSAYLAVRNTGADLSDAARLALAQDALGQELMLRYRVASLELRAQEGKASSLPPRWRRLAHLLRPMIGENEDLQRRSPSVEGLLANAFSNCGCHMCRDGAAACEVCNGLGTESSGQPCLECQGTGVAPCLYCGGTRWADEDILPQELREEVLRCRRAKSIEGGRRFLHLFRRHLNHGLAKLDSRQRKDLARACLRVRSRLRRVWEAAQGDPEDTAAQDVKRTLKSVQRRWEALTGMGPPASLAASRAGGSKQEQGL